MVEYEVTRAHIGDRAYEVGDTRTARPEDVAHLIGRCLIDIKAAPAVKNKMAKPLKNKAGQ